MASVSERTANQKPSEYSETDLRAMIADFTTRIAAAAKKGDQAEMSKCSHALHACVNECRKRGGIPAAK
jgi:hypothetical protein